MDEDIIVPALFFVTIMVLALGIPLVRAYVRRMEATPLTPQIPADLAVRLDRIEAIVETVAVEVERLAEGQRFTTRLLSEGAMQPQSAAVSGPGANAMNHGATDA